MTRDVVRSSVVRAPRKLDSVDLLASVEEGRRPKESSNVSADAQKSLHGRTSKVGAADNAEGNVSEKSDHQKWSPSIFIVVLSFIQSLMFVGAVKNEKGPVDLNTFCAGCVLDDGSPSSYVFDPNYRWHIHRYVLIVFAHRGAIHLISNLMMQNLVGVPLENIHGCVRVARLYFMSALFGSMVEYVVRPDAYAVGASGAISGLNFALLAHVVLVPWRKTKIFFIVLYLAGELYGMLTASHCGNIGHGAHLGGAITGIFFGMAVLRNVVKHKWEETMRKWCAGIYLIIFVGVGIAVVLIEPNSKSPFTNCNLVL